MAINSEDYKFKIILLGESGVGKTSMTCAYTNMTFNSNHSMVNLSSKELTVEGKRVKLCIWETSSQKWFKNVAPNYYDGILLVYDTTDLKTFQALSDWLTQLRQKSDGAVSLVVGNKIDHPDSTAVSRDLTLKFTRDEDLEFMESSSRNSDNVIKIFEHLTLKILQAKNLVSCEEINCDSSTSLTHSVPDQSDEHELTTEKLQCPDTSSSVTSHEHELTTEQLQCPDTSFTVTAHEQNVEHELSTEHEQLQQPDSQNFTNGTKHESHEGLQEPQQTTCSRVNGNLSTSHTVVDSDNDEELDLSFVWVSFLPPIVKLPSDITPLQVGRRRTSADSVLSLMTESEQITLRFGAE